MRTRHAASVIALCTLAGGGTGVTACGAAHASTEHAPRSPLTHAYANTVAEKTARIGIHETVTVGSGATQKVTTVTGSGVTDLGGRQLSLDFTAPSIGSLAVRVVPPMLYVQLPAKDRTAVPGSKSWIGVNLQSLASAKLGASLAQLQSSSQSSTNALALLEAASAEPLKEAGLASLHGVTTTAYKATVDFSKIAAEDPAAAAELKKVQSALGSAKIPVEVWVDNQQRLRQVMDTVSLPAHGTRPATSVVSTVDLYDFGVPVTVAAPPASSVFDVTAQALAAASSAIGTNG